MIETPRKYVSPPLVSVRCNSVKIHVSSPCSPCAQFNASRRMHWTVSWLAKRLNDWTLIRLTSVTRLKVYIEFWPGLDLKRSYENCLEFVMSWNNCWFKSRWAEGRKVYFRGVFIVGESDIAWPAWRLFAKWGHWGGGGGMGMREGEEKE